MAHRTDDELRAMLLAGIGVAGELTGEIRAQIERMHIPAREDRPKPEAMGMSEKIMLQLRAIEMAWFASHPTEDCYYRRMVPGEFPPDVTAHWVRVRKIDPRRIGRVRTPVIRVLGANGVEWADWKGTPPSS